MTEAKSINPAKPLSPGLNYVGLKERGLEIVRRMAGEIWTDYNEHDPGVTTLEQLCYALTELSYRAELPIEDLLVGSGTHAIDPEHQGLFGPQTILSCNPLTEGDYRKLIVDRVPSVANAWLTPHRPSHPGAVNGLYEIELYVPGISAGSDDAGARGAAVRGAAIRNRVRRLYTRYRSLCEDIHVIHVLKPVPATLAARVAIHPSAAPASVLARLFYEAGRFLAPEFRREALDTLIADDETPAGIFSGPLLRAGFISDDQLQPRLVNIAIADITRVLLSTEGVSGVRDVCLAIAGASIDTSGQRSDLSVPRRSILRLDTRPVQGTSGIRLFRKDVECRPDPDAVQRELDRLWADHRRTYDVRAQCKRLLACPQGQPIDVGQYFSIQQQFPAVYGIGAYGVPEDATDLRKAQARQFKGYLLVFEQLLADSFARVAAVTDLCAILRGRRGPFFQYLNSSVPDVEPLLKGSYRASLARIARSSDRTLERRNRFLDFMLATCGETVEPMALPPASPPPKGTDSAEGAVHARCKLRLLRLLPLVGRGRGAGCDYLAPPLPRKDGGARVERWRAAGVEIKSRLQLGMSAAAPRPFAELLDELGVTMIETAPLADRASMLRHGRYIDQKLERIGHSADYSERPPAPRSTVSEELLIAATDPGHYRIGTLPGETAITVVCRAPSQRLWQLAGKYADRETALAEATALLTLARTVNRQARRLYIVEHTLLRFGRSRTASGGAGSDFEPSFTASAVIGVPAREANDPGYRQSVREVIRANTPAHIVVTACFLRLSRVSQFESLYSDWRRALRGGHGRELIVACQRLRDFLTPDRP